MESHRQVRLQYCAAFEKAAEEWYHAAYGIKGFVLDDTTRDFLNEVCGDDPEIICPGTVSSETISSCTHELTRRVIRYCDQYHGPVALNCDVDTLHFLLREERRFENLLKLRLNLIACIDHHRQRRDFNGASIPNHEAFLEDLVIVTRGRVAMNRLADECNAASDRLDFVRSSLRTLRYFLDLVPHTPRFNIWVDASQTDLFNKEWDATLHSHYSRSPRRMDLLRRRYFHAHDRHYLLDCLKITGSVPATSDAITQTDF